MKRCVCALAVSVTIWATAPSSTAQLLNKQAPVIVGHYHLNVSSVDAHRKFWVDTLGGTATKIGNNEVGSGHEQHGHGGHGRSVGRLDRADRGVARRFMIGFRSLHAAVGSWELGIGS